MTVGDPSPPLAVLYATRITGLDVRTASLVVAFAAPNSSPGA